MMDSWQIEGSRALRQLAWKRAFEETEESRLLRRRTCATWTADAEGKTGQPVLLMP